MERNRVVCAAAAALAAVGLWMGPAMGGLATWDGAELVGAPGDGLNWNDPTNWSRDGSPDTAPADAAPGDGILFASPAAGPIDLNINRVASSLGFDQDIVLGIADALPVLTLSGEQVNVAAGRSALVNAILAGSAGLTKSGAGALTLASAANSFTGAVSISAGVLSISADGCLGHSANDVSFDGGTLRVMSSIDPGSGRTFKIESAGVIDVAAGAVLTLADANQLSGGGGLTKMGDGRLLLNANYGSSFAGGLAIDDGEVWLDNAGGMGGGSVAVNGGVLINSAGTVSNAISMAGGTLAAQGADRIFSGDVTFEPATASTISLDDAAAGGTARGMTLSGIVGGSGNLIITAAAAGKSLSLSNSGNTFSGTIIISGVNATLLARSLTNLGSTLGSATLELAGGKLDIQMNGVDSAGSGALLPLNNDVRVTADSTISVNRGGSVSANIIQLGDLSIGGQTLIVTGGNQYDLQFGGTATLTGDPTFETPTAGVDLILAGPIEGARKITKTGAGSLRISGDSPGFGGTVQVDAGTLQLESANGINARPITLMGGTLALRNDVSTDFVSDVSVAGSATINADRLTGGGMTNGHHRIGSLTVDAGQIATIGGANGNGVMADSVMIGGTVRVGSGAVLYVDGGMSGAGPLVMQQTSQSVSSPANRGVWFTASPAAAVSNPIQYFNDSSDPILGVDGVTVTYNGSWSGEGSSSDNFIYLRDGARLLVGKDAVLDGNRPDFINTRSFRAIGIGIGNVIEFDAGFIADHTGYLADPGSATPTGLSSWRVGNATWITHSTASLPSIWKKTSYGDFNHHGVISFDLDGSAVWQVSSAAQEYDGGIYIKYDTEIRTDADLTHTGLVAIKSDVAFQTSAADAVIRKTGPGTLHLSGDQGYHSGTVLQVEEGAVVMNTDPGAGWIAGTYTRDANGDILTPPPAAPNLNVKVAGGASVRFAADVSRIASLELAASTSAAIADGPSGRILTTSALAITGDGTFALHDNAMVVHGGDLAALVTLVYAGRITSVPASPYTGLAVLLNSDGQGGTILDTLLLQPLVADDVLLVQALHGDGDLNGTIDGADYFRLDRGFLAGLGGYQNGDVNLDAAINGDDFYLVDRAYLGQSLPVVVAAAPVPEPGGLGLLALAAALLCRRGNR